MYDSMIATSSSVLIPSEKLCWSGGRPANSGPTIAPSLSDDCGQISTSRSRNSPSLTIIYSLGMLALGVRNPSHQGCWTIPPSLRMPHDYITLPTHSVSTQRERTVPYMSVSFETNLFMLCEPLSVGKFPLIGAHDYLGGSLYCQANKRCTCVIAAGHNHSGRSVTSADSAESTWVHNLQMILAYIARLKHGHHLRPEFLADSSNFAAGSSGGEDVRSIRTIK